MSKITIRDIKCFILKPVKKNPNLVVVKVETSEPGLYGLGCATFAYRSKAVKSVVEDYFKPILIGRDVSQIEDIWHLLQYSSYWRSGPIEMNAISGIDIALWDIKGKMANMPIYDLLGGKCRDKVVVYRYAEGNTLEEICESFAQRLEEGNTHIRLRRGYGSFGGKNIVTGCFHGQEGSYYDANKYIHETIEMFEKIRTTFGREVQICHDVHERLDPVDAVRLSKFSEPFDLFFLEDVLSPEQGDWFRRIRETSTTPIAVGELFVNSKEWDYLVANRLLDYIRVHITAIGGITPAMKLAHLCDAFGIKTAFHGPTDVTPIGHAANIHMDYALHNFGIQEWAGLTEIEKEIFPGSPELKGNAVYLNDKPGIGVDFNEELAAKFPADDITWIHRWQFRTADGTVHTP